MIIQCPKCGTPMIKEADGYDCSMCGFHLERSFQEDVPDEHSTNYGIGGPYCALPQDPAA